MNRIIDKRSRKYRKDYKRNKFNDTIFLHIQNNIKQYIVLMLLFLIGIIIGVIFINNASTAQTTEISTYINSSINLIKDNGNLNELGILKSSISNNLKITLLIWIMGMVVIGISFVYLIICYKGFCLGYTISSILLTLGTGRGIVFLFSGIFLHTIIYIPCLLALGTSGIKVYNSIMKDKRRENIKFEIIRHTLFCLLILIILILSSCIEAFISKSLLILCKNYI